ncbi:MAG: hypothetical protein JSR82_02305 [Verrucomicrobia bacterium]|nr:hypothetical protein [Verrucomicrobiota bacterium]
MDFKGVQTLIGLMADTMRGSKEAAETFAELIKRPTNYEELVAWIRRFVPMGGNPLRPELLGQQIEDTARVLGFVPRSRYVDLLEQNEILKNKLADAEKTITRLQAMVGTAGNEGAAKKLLDGLTATVDNTLRIQADLVRSIADAFKKPSAEEVKKAEQEKAARQKEKDEAAG